MRCDRAQKYTLPANIWMSVDPIAGFLSILEAASIRISMDGRGRALDNIFVERLLRSLKYEDIYLKLYASISELALGLHAYFRFYNDERLHQSLAYRTPAQIHYAGAAV